MRSQTRVLNQSVSGLVAVRGPEEGGQMVYPVVLEHEQSLMPTCLIHDLEPEPTFFPGSLGS